MGQSTTDLITLKLFSLLLEHGLSLLVIQHEGPYSGVAASKSDNAVRAVLAQASCQEHDCCQGSILCCIFCGYGAPICTCDLLSLQVTAS